MTINIQFRWVTYTCGKRSRELQYRERCPVWVTKWREWVTVPQVEVNSQEEAAGLPSSVPSPATTVKE